MITIGAQFYTIRNACKDLDGFAESLRKVADMGYTAVQISGTCDYDGAWLDAELKKNGLTCAVTHTKESTLFENTEAVLHNHDLFGCKNVGLGYHNYGKAEATIDTYKAFADRLPAVIAKVKASGKYFMYHHHDFEFVKVDGKRIFDRLFDDFAPEDLGFIPDTYWLQAGGVSPAEYIKKCTGRIPCIHLKDYGYGMRMEAVGDGNLNFGSILAAAEDAGTEYALVEQDNCNGEDPFVCLKRSYDYLRAMGLK